MKPTPLLLAIAAVQAQTSTFTVPEDLPDGVYRVVQPRHNPNELIIKSADGGSFKRSLTPPNNNNNNSTASALDEDDNDVDSDKGDHMVARCWPGEQVPKEDARDSWYRFVVACETDDMHWHEERPVALLATAGDAISYMCNWGHNPCVMSEVLEVGDSRCGKGATITPPDDPEEDDPELTYVSAARGDWKRWRRGYGWGMRSLRNEICGKPDGVK